MKLVAKCSAFVGLIVCTTSVTEGEVARVKTG